MSKYRKWLWICGFFLFVFNGCGNKSRLEQKKEWEHAEAKLHDIPIMMQARPGKTIVQPEVMSIQYTTSHSLEDVHQWYAEHMERMGWEKLHVFSTVHIVMLYEKPSRYCALSIEHKNKETVITIDVGHKQDYVSLHSF